MAQRNQLQRRHISDKAAMLQMVHRAGGGSKTCQVCLAHWLCRQRDVSAFKPAQAETIELALDTRRSSFRNSLQDEGGSLKRFAIAVRSFPSSSVASQGSGAAWTLTKIGNVTVDGRSWCRAH